MLDSHNQICHWCATSDSARSCIPGRASRIKQRRFQPMDGAGGGLGRNIPAVEGAGPWDLGRGHPPPAEGAAVGARAGDEAGACGEVREAKWRGRPCGTAVLSSRGLLWLPGGGGGDRGCDGHCLLVLKVCPPEQPHGLFPITSFPVGPDWETPPPAPPGKFPAVPRGSWDICPTAARGEAGAKM